MSLLHWIILGFFQLVVNYAAAQVEPGHYELGCPVGAYRHGTFCYAVSGDDQLTRRQAEDICKGQGGSLAMIKDYETHVFLHRLRMRKHMHCYWFGLHDLKGEGNWMFEDGTKLTQYSDWDIGEPNNNGGVQDCGSLLMHRKLKWDDEYCYMKFLYVCEFEEASCAKNATILEKMCYEPSHDFATYDDAKSSCKTRNGQLAQIKTEAIDKLVKSLIFNDTFWLTMTESQVREVFVGLALKFTWVQGSWIGIKYAENEWKYDDGNTANFTQWSDNKMSSSKRCATLGKQMNPYSCGIHYSYGKTTYSHDDIDGCYNYAEKWNTADCYEKNSYICQFTVNLNTVQSTESTSNKIGTNSQEYTANENDRQINNGIHIGVAPFIILVLSCILIGMLLTIVIYGTVVLKRNRNIHTYQDMKRIFQNTEDQT